MIRSPFFKLLCCRLKHCCLTNLRPLAPLVHFTTKTTKGQAGSMRCKYSQGRCGGISSYRFYKWLDGLEACWGFGHKSQDIPMDVFMDCEEHGSKVLDRLSHDLRQFFLKVMFSQTARASIELS